MRITEDTALVSVSGGMKNAVTAEIWYDSDEDVLPTNYAEGSIAYCYSGDDKGKVYVFDGISWIEQE